MRKIVLSLMLLTLAINLIPLSASAADVQNIAMEVPTAITTENRNGMQIIIKSYAVSSKIDPVVMIDEPFYQNGYRYTYVNIDKFLALYEHLMTKLTGFIVIDRTNQNYHLINHRAVIGISVIHLKGLWLDQSP